MKAASIISLFESKAAITSLIGSGADMRLYPQELPQSLSGYPAITFRLLPVIPTNDNSGPSQFDFRSVDFFAYGYIKDDVEELIATVREELEDTSGVFAGININHILYMTDSDGFNEDLELHTHQLELQFNYRR